MPLNVRLAEPELTCILRHSGARFLFHDKKLTAPQSTLSIAFGEEYETLLKASDPYALELQAIDEHSAASLFYTSGTTGEPKGVVHSHRALYLHALSVALTFHIDRSTVELHTIPLFHANGWGRPHAATLMGARQIVLPRFRPNEIARLIPSEQVTSLCLVPTMAEQLLAAPEMADCDASSLLEIHLGGSPVSGELTGRLTARFNCRVTVGYGMTETGPVAVSDGKPVVGSAMNVDPTGEVLLAGDHLFTGYWQEAPRHTPWLATGDLGAIDPEGQLTITGRKKEMIVSGGENIASAEIEAALTAHPAIAECAVVAVPNAKWGEEPLAYIVLRHPATEEELRLWLEGRLARFKIPKLWRFVPGPLPRTATGKVVKRGMVI